MQLVITRDGKMRCVYSEEIDLAVLGALQLWRASHVEPDEQGQWYADLWPMGGPKLGPFRMRSLALEAEISYLNRHCEQPGPLLQSTEPNSRMTGLS